MVQAGNAGAVAVCVLLAATIAGVGDVCGDEVRLIKENGVTYQETLRTERVPIANVKWEDRTETVYKREYVTEYRDSNRTVYTPVTEYRWEPRLHGRWNPLIQPYVAYHWIPATRWETRVETVRTPVTYSRVTPETRVVRAPTRTLGFAEREVIVNRVAVDQPSTLPAHGRVIQEPASIARRVGGISALENDPPRKPAEAAVLLR